MRTHDVVSVGRIMDKFFSALLVAFGAGRGGTVSLRPVAAA